MMESSLSPPMPHHPATRLGHLIGIGVGPGDPELITVKALRILEASPVVAFPAGRHHQPGLAEQIITPWLHPHQIRLPLDFAFVRDTAQLRAAWHQAAERVWQYLHQGQDVVFASEGDIGFYSTFTYLAQTLQQLHPQVRIRAIPGICSPLAAAAVLGLPLTILAERLAVLPALYSVSELAATLDWADMVVLMKVSSVYQEVWALLDQRELLSRSYVIVNATRPDQKIYADLSHLPELTLPYFSLLVIQVTTNRLG